MSSAATDAVTGGSDVPHGVELVELGERRARGRVLVRGELKGPLGTVHAGVYAVIAEHLTEMATLRAVGSDRKSVALMSAQTSFLRPVTEGTIDAVASARHRGRTTWVWEVEFSDDRGRLCVLSRMTLAVSDTP